VKKWQHVLGELHFMGPVVPGSASLFGALQLQMVLVLKVWEPTVLVLIESVQSVLMETVLRAQMLLLLI
jgi:hypothetical protein